MKFTVIAHSGVYTIIDDKIIKSMFNKNSEVTIKNKHNSNKDLITRACLIGIVVPM